MAILILLYENQLFRRKIAENESIFVGSGKKDAITIPDLKPAHFRLRLKDGLLLAQKSKSKDIVDAKIPADSTTPLSEEKRLAVLWTEDLGTSDTTYPVPYQGVIHVGRKNDNQIVLGNPMVGRHHFTLTSESGVLHAEDLNSTNGLYLNGKRITKAALKSGDTLDIMAVRITLRNSVLSFENVGTQLKINPLTADFLTSAARKTNRPEFYLQPRFRDALPSEPIVLARAPSKMRKSEGRRGIFSSLLSSGVMVGTSLAMGAASPALLAARAAGLISPISNAISGKKSNSRSKKEQEAYERARIGKYGDYIEAQRARIRLAADKQREIINRENPSPEECMALLFDCGSRLWERMPNHSDFLSVRLGNGYTKLCVEVKAPGDSASFQMEEDEVQELAQQIIEETRIVDNVAVQADFLRYQTISLSGSRKNVAELARSVLICLTSLHFCQDVRIVGFFRPEDQELWEALRWLPHVWDEEKQNRFLCFSEPGSPDFDRLCERFRDTFQERRGNSENRRGRPHPHYLVLCGLDDVEYNFPLKSYLCSNDPRLGVTTLFMGGAIPKECQFAIRVDDQLAPGCSFACEYQRADVKFYFTPDPPVELSRFDLFCRTMSAIEVRTGTKVAELPGTVTFLEGMGVETVAELNAWERWTESESSKSLSAPIAAMRGGKNFYLDIEKHGPNGLVAGMVGSGKSEMLTAWVLSVAACHSPSKVCFLIMDYKGGIFARSVEGLPHVVGTITNLGPNGKVISDENVVDAKIYRCVCSLEAELERRETIIGQAVQEGSITDTKIQNYRKGYVEGKFKTNLPYLILVADEFAELKKRNPALVERLNKVARLGRALGIWMVLATQQPAGVVDEQIRANTNFQLCLKVKSKADSNDMIKTSDAAKLSQVGRGYVRVGTDEQASVYECVQTFWSGAPYLGRRTAGGGNQVRVVALNGERIKTVTHEKTRFKSEQNELQAVVKYLHMTAEKHGLAKLPAPWKPELPGSLALSELDLYPGFQDGQWNAPLPWLSVPLGLCDLPSQQQQNTLCLNLSEEGHYAIYGLPGTGKTTLLKTIVAALGEWYTPADVNLYLLDFGGWSMNVFQDMPHVGGVALDTEEEKFSKLAVILREEIARRKKLFNKNGVASLKSYRISVAKDLPAIILAIDNVVALLKTYPSYEDVLMDVAQNGMNYGIYLIYTANSEIGIPYKLHSKITGGISFAQQQKSDYTGIVGRVEGYGLPKVKGRAFFKGSNAPVEFQAALYGEGKSEPERVAWLKERLARMNEAWKGPRPAGIPVMPEEVTAELLAGSYTEPDRVPVGYGLESIQPEYLDMREHYAAVIAGNLKTGKSRTLCAIAELIRTKFPDTLFFTFDSSGKGLSALQGVGDGYALCKDAAATAAVMNSLAGQLNGRLKRKNAGESLAELPRLCVWIDDMNEFVQVADDVQQKMDIVLTKAAGLGVMVFAAGRTTDLQRLAVSEQLTHDLLSGQNALAVSGTIMLHSSYLKNDAAPTEKNVELGKEQGFLYRQGHVIKLKRLQA